MPLKAIFKIYVPLLIIVYYELGTKTLEIESTAFSLILLKFKYNKKLINFGPKFSL